MIPLKKIDSAPQEFWRYSAGGKREGAGVRRARRARRIVIPFSGVSGLGASGSHLKSSFSIPWVVDDPTQENRECSSYVLEVSDDAKKPISPESFF